MIWMRMSDNNQAHVSRASTSTLECVDDSIRTAPHATVNDNDALADQKETLDEIQRSVGNRNYSSAHIFSDVSFAILGRNTSLTPTTFSRPKLIIHEPFETHSAASSVSAGSAPLGCASAALRVASPKPRLNFVNSR
jgi:hypothetical protein